MNNSYVIELNSLNIVIASETYFHLSQYPIPRNTSNKLIKIWKFLFTTNYQMPIEHFDQKQFLKYLINYQI